MNQSANQSAKSIGPYDLIQRVGQGGFAEVFRAQHREKGDAVAVKVLRPQFASDNSAIDGLQREFDILRQIDVPGVPKVIMQGNCGPRPALVMDLVKGHGIHRLIAEGVMFDKVTALVEMIRLVGKIHAAGILHNDLKPENFLLGGDNRVYLVDFGNASRADEKQGLLGRLFKRRRSISGTPAYMAPELVRGQAPRA